MGEGSKAIPAFYCCYLLRSTTKPTASPYVGSTPHILRRWKQHNGLAKGGAVKTARAGFRPWQVSCIVYGFPSKLAALQFEWAWQHMHLTRHVQQPRKKRTSSTVYNKLADLHALLMSQSFNRWPLSLRFFTPEAYDSWTLWCSRSGQQVRQSMHVYLDPLAVSNITTPANKDSGSATEPAATEQQFELPEALKQVDLGYSFMIEHLRKSLAISESTDPIHCAICQANIDMSSDKILICPHNECTCATHLFCASKHFLSGAFSEDLVPINGKCPRCQQDTPWITLVKELSLRTTNPRLVTKHLNPRRRKDAESDMSDDEDSEEDWLYEEMHGGEPSPRKTKPPAVSSDTIQGFRPIDDFSDSGDDLPPSGQVLSSKWSSPSKRVIPDSEGDLLDIS